MPKVGKKHFPYTSAGKKKAKKYAKKRGLKVKGSKNPGYYAEGTINMSKNDEYLIGESIWDTYRDMAYILMGEERTSYLETLPTKKHVPAIDNPRGKPGAPINPRRLAARERAKEGRIARRSAVPATRAARVRAARRARRSYEQELELGDDV